MSLNRILFNEFLFIIILISISQKARECIHEYSIHVWKLYNSIKRFSLAEPLENSLQTPQVLFIMMYFNLRMHVFL
jgi:hypothetical protein